MSREASPGQNLQPSPVPAAQSSGSRRESPSGRTSPANSSRSSRADRVERISKEELLEAVQLGDTSVLLPSGPKSKSKAESCGVEVRRGMKEAGYAQEALKLDTQGKDASVFSALQEILFFPLPFPWAASASKEQRIYFYHRGLKLSVWDHPMLDMHKELSFALACGVQQKRQVESNLRSLLDKIRSRRTIQRIIEVWQGPLQGERTHYLRVGGEGAKKRFDNPRVACAALVCLQVAMVEDVWGRALSRPFEMSWPEVVREAQCLSAFVLLKPLQAPSDGAGQLPDFPLTSSHPTELEA